MMTLRRKLTPLPFAARLELALALLPLRFSELDSKWALPAL